MKFNVIKNKSASLFFTASLQKCCHSLLVVFMLMLLTPEPATAEQVYYATAETAANNLYEAIEQKNSESMSKLLGTDYKQLLPLDEIDDKIIQLFISGWKKSHKLIAGDEDQYYIAVGTQGWTFPIPLQKEQKGWYFDTVLGADNMRIRTIGRNELATMQAVLAYYDAQMEYAEQDRNADGYLEYAQKFISTPGQKNGLYWEINPGETPSPLGTLFANKTIEKAYKGYYYKILKAQGKNAPGGAYSYMSGDRMTSGFALIAWPAEYGETGVMSFLISYHGVIYEKNQGADTGQIAENTESFDPDSSWVRSEESPASQTD